jgi:hypothetical protein
MRTFLDPRNKAWKAVSILAETSADRAVLQKAMKGFALARQQAAQFSNNIKPQKIQANHLCATGEGVEIVQGQAFLVHKSAMFLRHPSGVVKIPSNATIHRNLSGGTKDDAAHSISAQHGGESKSNVTPQNYKINRGVTNVWDKMANDTMAKGRMVFQFVKTYSPLGKDGTAGRPTNQKRANITFKQDGEVEKSSKLHVLNTHTPESRARANVLKLNRVRAAPAQAAKAYAAVAGTAARKIMGGSAAAVKALFGKGDRSGIAQKTPASTAAKTPPAAILPFLKK